MAESNFTKVRISNNIVKADEDKKVQQKKKILILISDFLEKHGYAGSAAYLNSELGFNINRFAVCDNMDLEIILQEFEVFYNMKYGRNVQIYKQFTEPTPSEKKTAPKRHRPKLPLTLPSLPTETCEPKTDAFNGGERHQGDILQPLGPYAVLPLDHEYRFLAGVISQEMLGENLNVSFEDIVGHDSAKAILKESLIYPMKYSQLYSIVSPWKGLLLFGPTGTGKTMLAKAAATECQSTFFNVSPAIFTSKWRGESEKMVKVLFDLARYHAPSVIFFDEVDAVISQRSSVDHEASRRFKSEFLTQMDGLKTVEERVFVLAASNSPWDIDVAFLRRLECRQYISLPNHEALKDLFVKYLPSSIQYASYKIPIMVDYDTLAEATGGYSGADVFLACKKVKLLGVRQIVTALENQDMNKKNHEFLPITSTKVLSVIHDMKPVQGKNLEKYDIFNNGVM